MTTYLKIFYDGTRFGGWAKQPSRKTVQGELEAAFKRTGCPVESSGCASRTDAGVSVVSQVVRVRHSGRIHVDALNRVLPRDVAVTHIAQSPPKIVGKRYIYVKPTPWIHGNLIRDALERVAAQRHLTRLYKKGGSAPTGELACTMGWFRSFPVLVFEAAGFGWQEIRRTVSALSLLDQQGTPDWAGAQSRIRAAPPADPRGLVLLEVASNGDWRPINSGLAKAERCLTENIRASEWQESKWMLALSVLRSGADGSNGLGSLISEPGFQPL